MHVELRSDGSCALREFASPHELRFDVLLASMVASYDNLVAMKQAGALVIAESPETARYPAMPMAAAEAGAHQVLPVQAIGRALVEAAGTRG